jgi:cell wall-associated NlpC family hydrolase
MIFDVKLHFPCIPTMGMVKKTLIAALLVAALPSVTWASAIYFVKEGDTLAGLSALFHTTVRDLKEFNGLKEDLLRDGMRLRIPDASLSRGFTDRLDHLPPAESLPLPPEVALPVAPGPLQGPELPLCRVESLEHLVGRGDTLSSLGRRYQVDVATLQRLNGLRPGAILGIGRSLVVRRQGPRTHLVHKGDTPWSIAKRYGLRVADLAAYNGQEDFSLRPGQELFVAPCQPPPPPSAAADQAGSATAAAIHGPFLPLPMVVDGSGGESVEVTPGEDGSGAAMVERLIAFAQQLLNVPYRFGGSTLKGIDCSAYVQKVYAFLDVTLPRTAREQFKLGTEVSREHLVRGDLVFFKTYAKYASHVGIYLGENKFIHASSKGKKVEISNFSDSYYQKRFIGGRRFDLDSVIATSPTPTKI